MIIGNRKLPSRSKWRRTFQNSSLIQVTQYGTAEDKPGDGHIKVCTVNTQSIRGKTGDVVEHVLSNKIDICAVTETWLKPADDAIKQECQPVGYSFTVGCGTGLLCRSNLTPSMVRSGEKKIIWVLWMAHKMFISCHKINCCLSANILKGTSNLTSHI